MELPESPTPEPTSRRRARIDKNKLAGLGVLSAGVFAIAALTFVTTRSSDQAEPETPEQLQFSSSETSIAEAGTLWIDTSNPEAVSGAFLAEFTKDVPAVEWQGDHTSCDGGTSSADLRTSTIARVNYYRAMAGVPAVVTENEEFSEKAHSGAIMMSVEGELTHEPPPSFACYTEVGFEAASNSNLYLGRTGPSAIDGYVEDPGEDNADVGHRNTLLHPPTTEMGVANIESRDGYDEANLVWVFDEQVFDKSTVSREQDGFVAWPPKGFVPQEVVYDRWSFSLPEADFTDATVTVTSNGEAIPLSSITKEGKPGRVPNPIIVWEPVLEDRSERVAYDIEIRNVSLGGQQQDYAYTVTVLEPLLG